MKFNETVTKVNGIKKGVFTKETHQSITMVNGVEYKKITNGVVRFVKYANIKGVNATGKTNPNETMVSAFIYHNSNTKCDYLQMATTKHHSKVKYYRNGVEITKAEYETATKAKPSTNKPVVFRVKLENLLSLGN